LHQEPITPPGDHVYLDKDGARRPNSKSVPDILYLLDVPKVDSTTKSANVMFGVCEFGIKSSSNLLMKEHKLRQTYCYAQNCLRIGSGSVGAPPVFCLRGEIPNRTNSIGAQIPCGVAFDMFVLREDVRDPVGDPSDQRRNATGENALEGPVVAHVPLRVFEPPESANSEPQARVQWYCQMLDRWNVAMKWVSESLLTRYSREAREIRAPTPISRNVTIGACGKFVYKSFDGSRERRVNADLWRAYSGPLFVTRLSRRDGGADFGLVTRYREGTAEPTPVHFLALLSTLQQMAAARHVHADIRDANVIFCSDSDDAFFIDWDFGGVAGEVKYPEGFRQGIPDGARASGAEAAGPVQQWHDVFALGSVMARYSHQAPSGFQEATRLLQQCSCDDDAAAALSDAVDLLRSLPNMRLRRATPIKEIARPTVPVTLEADSPPRSPQDEK
jgi:hypothetical protein